MRTWNNRVQYMQHWHRGQACVYGKVSTETQTLQSHTQATLLSNNICS